MREREKLVSYCFHGNNFPSIDLCFQCMNKHSSSRRWVQYVFNQQSLWIWTLIFGAFFLAMFSFWNDPLYFRSFMIYLLANFVLIFHYQCRHDVNILVYLSLVMVIAYHQGIEILKIHVDTTKSLGGQFLMCYGFIFVFEKLHKIVEQKQLDQQHNEKKKWIIPCSFLQSQYPLPYSENNNNDEKNQCYICWSDDQESDMIVPCLCKNMPVHASCLEIEMQSRFQPHGLMFIFVNLFGGIRFLNLIQKSSTMNFWVPYCPRCNFFYQWKWKSQWWILKTISDLELRDCMAFIMSFLFSIQLIWGIIHLIMMFEGHVSFLFTLHIVVDFVAKALEWDIQIKQFYSRMPFEYLSFKENYKL